MVVGMVVLGLISLGLPLLGFWVGGRSMLQRMLTRDQSGACTSAARGRGLGPEQLAHVRTAMITGRRLEDPAERALVVCWGSTLIAEDAARARRHPGAYRALVIALALWGLALVVTAVVVVVQARYDHVPAFPLAWWLLFTVLTLHHRATVRRAVRRNSDVDERIPAAL